MDRLFLLLTLFSLSPVKRVEGYPIFREKDDEGLLLEALLRGLFGLVKDPLALADVLAATLLGGSKQILYGVEVSFRPSTVHVETVIVNVLCAQMQELSDVRPLARAAYDRAFEAAWQRMLAVTLPGSHFGREDQWAPARNLLLQRLNELVLQGWVHEFFAPKSLRSRLAALLIDGRFGLVQDLVRVFYWTGIFSGTEADTGTIYINRAVLPNRSVYNAMREVCTDAVLMGRGVIQPGRHWALAAMHMTEGEESACSFNKGSVEALQGGEVALDLRHVFMVMLDDRYCKPGECPRSAQALAQWCVLGGSEAVVKKLTEATPQPQLVLTEHGIVTPSTTDEQEILLRLLGRGDWASAYLLLQEFGWTGVFTRMLLNGMRGGGFSNSSEHAESARVEAALTALLAPAFVREYEGAILQSQNWGGVAAIGQQLMLRIDAVRAHLLNEIRRRDAKDMRALEDAIEASTVIRPEGFNVGAMSEYITDHGEFSPPSPELFAQKQALVQRQADEFKKLVTRLQEMARTALTEAATHCQPVRLNVFE